MNVFNIINLLGGVALFLFGMSLMGEGLKRVAGNRLELVLFRLTSTPLKGLLLGTGVTAVIQSSSATSVMTVGFVNSGIMKLKQAVPIIIGAIIGTSITGWVICLSSIEGNGWTKILSTATLSSMIAVVGIVLRMFSKDKTKKYIGDILLGFAVLMFGMSYMSGAVEPLRTNETFIEMLTAFSNPVIGLLSGFILAAVLQSASAAVGILQALSMTGVITFSVAWPILLGISVGASIPVLLSSIGARVAGKRTSWAYFFICLFGVAFCGAVFYLLDAFIHFSFTSQVLNTVGIAAVNTIFRAIAGIALLPFAGLITNMLEKLIKASDEEIAANIDFDRLDERFLSHPATAVEQSRITVLAMASKTKANIFQAIDLIDNYSDEKFKTVEDLEESIDKYEDKIATYLLKLNTHHLSQEQNRRVSEYLHVVTDFERISDHAMNIAEAARELHEKKITFSSAGKHELGVLIAAVRDILDISIDNFALENTDKLRTVEPLEELIDTLCNEMKSRHVKRMQSGKCSMNVGFVFNDLLSNFERVGDHCSNIALAMIEIDEDDFDTHKGVYALKNKELYEEYSEKYALGEISG